MCHFMKDRQILLLSYYLICNKIIYGIKIDRENNIRIEEFSRIYIKGIGKLI
jgi:hypothetical protein